VNKEAERLDKGSLNGLRGLFAFHIMAYHACLGIPFVVHVEPVVYLYANVDMPLFFLLSGFSLALGYGKTTWNGSTRCCFGCKTKALDGINIENPDDVPKIFDSLKFYKKRLIRIFPLHYLSHLLVWIVWKFG
jgi:peptidoglycan/LPS O-acetylase OafA/YrhL